MGYTAPGAHQWSQLPGAKRQLPTAQTSDGFYFFALGVDSWCVSGQAGTLNMTLPKTGQVSSFKSQPLSR